MRLRLTRHPARVLEDGWIWVQITGPDGAPVVLFSSSDLVRWQPVLNTTITNGVVDWLVPPGEEPSYRYFRIAPPE